MKFGIREICDVDFYKYVNGIPSASATFRIDTAKTSTIESATTTVYAQGGKGNARRMSWEGERTLTFTVEDALFSKESIAALIGESFDTSGTIRIKDSTTAGTYKIQATTLIRNDEGEDEVATIVINKAKLQSNLNLPFSPTGDPLALTFTFDAFPDEAGEFMTIQCNHFKSTATDDTVTSITIIGANGARYSANKTGSTDVVLKHNSTTVTFGGTAVDGLTITTDDTLVNATSILASTQTITLAAGSTTTWYVV